MWQELDCDSLTLAKARSGRHVVIAHINSPTPERYPTCISFASLLCCLGSGSPVAALNFFNQLASEGRGVERAGLGYADFINVGRCL